MVSTNANLAKMSSWKTRTYLFGNDNSIEKDGFGKKNVRKGKRRGPVIALTYDDELILIFEFNRSDNGPSASAVQRL